MSIITLIFDFQYPLYFGVTIMHIEEILFSIYLVIAVLGHCTFSMQRVTFNLAKEFNVTQDFFNVLLPVWLVPFQWFLTIAKYSLLLCIFVIVMNDEGFLLGFFVALVIFCGTAIAHLILPLLPAHWFFQTLYNNAKCMQETYDYNLGSHYIKLLRLSRLF